MATPTEPRRPPRQTGVGAAQGGPESGTWRRSVTGERQAGARTTWQYRQLSLPRGTGRDAAAAVLVEAAELEHWELARLRLHPDGHRTIWLRRRIVRVLRTA